VRSDTTRTATVPGPVGFSLLASLMTTST
jgi:hypothetical protein